MLKLMPAIGITAPRYCADIVVLPPLPVMIVLGYLLDGLKNRQNLKSG